MLIAYFDDSGSHGDSDVVLWNGLFGNHYQWQLFNELWVAKLKDPSPGKESLKRFHMFECQNSVGEFSGWSRTATDFLVHELGDIVLRCGLHSNGAAISRKDWDDLVKGDLRTALGDAEGYSMRIAFVRATKWAREIAFQNEMKFVFDRRKEREQEGKRIFDLFQHYAEIEQISPAPVSIAFSDSYRTLPLQAADMFAWEQYQYARDFLNSNGAMKVARRSQLRRLSKGGKITLGIALRSAIEKMVAMEKGNSEKIGKAAELMICDQAEFERRFKEP
jgi:Protein of unknown function (DUF3800)